MADPSGRYPLGVLTRAAPDWFDERLGVGGYQLTIATGENFLLVSLYNNASDGSVLKVYAISCSGDGGGGCSAWVDMGTPPGTLVGPCTCIRPDYAAPAGLIFQSEITTSNPFPNPFSIPPNSAFLGTSGFDSFTHIAPFPLFVIPVGYALHVTNFNAGELMGAAFWYQQAEQ